MNAQHAAHLPGPAGYSCHPDDLECRLRQLVDAGPAAIDERLAQLDNCWTAGRAAKATAGGAIVLGLALGLTLHPGWLALPIAGALILTQYFFSRQSVLGLAFRAMGFPAGADVEQEKLALRALRGDFQRLPTVHQVEDKDAITRMEGEGGIVYEPDDTTSVDANQAVKEAMGAARK